MACDLEAEKTRVCANVDDDRGVREGFFKTLQVAIFEEDFLEFVVEDQRNFHRHPVSQMEHNRIFPMDPRFDCEVFPPVSDVSEQSEIALHPAIPRHIILRGPSGHHCRQRAEPHEKTGKRITSMDFTALPLQLKHLLQQRILAFIGVPDSLFTGGGIEYFFQVPELGQSLGIFAEGAVDQLHLFLTGLLQIVQIDAKTRHGEEVAQKVVASHGVQIVDIERRSGVEACKLD